MRCLAPFFFLSALSLFAVSLPHQGRVLISGDPFNGTGYFRFALVDQAGEIVWNHQGTYGDPETDITIDVAKGFYQCRLGDISIDGMAELPSSIFVPDHPLKLRIWFNDGVNGLKRLGQDQNLMMAPYSMTTPKSYSETIASSFADEIVRQATASGVSVDELIARISALSQQITSTGGITNEMIPTDIFEEMNETKNLYESALVTMEEMNATLTSVLSQVGQPVTTSMLDETILKYLKPEISKQPISQIVTNGGEAKLSVSAEGKFLNYQWKRDGVDLPGEDNPEFYIPNFDPSQHNGDYTVVVSNDFGSVQTMSVSLLQSLESFAQVQAIDEGIGLNLLAKTQSFFSSFDQISTLGGSDDSIILAIEATQNLVDTVNTIGLLIEKLQNNESFQEIASALGSTNEQWNEGMTSALRLGMNQFLSTLAKEVNAIANPTDDPLSYIFGFEAIIGEPIAGKNKIMEEEYNLFGLEGNGTLQLFRDDVNMTLPTADSDTFTIVITTPIFPEEVPSQALVRGSDDLAIFLDDPYNIDIYQFYGTAEKMQHVTIEIDRNFSGEDNIPGTADDGRSILLGYEEIPFKIKQGEIVFIIGDNFSFEVGLKDKENLARIFNMDKDFNLSNVRKSLVSKLIAFDVENFSNSTPLVVDFNFPSNWNRLESYKFGDVVKYEGIFWESKIEENFNHRPDTERTAIWGALPSGYDISTNEWNVEVTALQNQNFYTAADGLLFENYDEATSHNEDILLYSFGFLPQSMDPDILWVIANDLTNEISFPVVEFNLSSPVYEGEITFDSYTQIYKFWARPNGSQEPYNYVMDFELTNQNTPVVELPSAGPDGVDAETKVILDANSEIVGLKVTNPGSYSWVKTESTPVPPEFQKASIFLPNGSTLEATILWAESPDNSEVFRVSGFSLDESGDGIDLGLSPINPGENFSFTLSQGDEISFHQTGDSSSIQAIVNLEKIILAQNTQPSTHTVDLNSSVDLEMIWVEPGTFMMGSPETEEGRGTDETQHEVTLTKGFYLGKYEVTQAQYEAVMAGNTQGLEPTPSMFENNPNRPVERVLWDDVQVFLERLNEQEAGNLPAGWAYTLPTEAEWEYACRAGTTTVYNWGDTITSDNANYNQNIGETSNVGSYAPNQWGFYDMHGNIWEWTSDTLRTFSSVAQTDPFGLEDLGADRVGRGGSWNLSDVTLRSAHRYSLPPRTIAGDIGFRLAYKWVGEGSSPQSSFIWENEELDLNELDQFMGSQNANYSKTGQVEPVAYSRDLWDISQDRRADKYAYFDGVVQSYAPMQYTETNADDPNGYNDLLHSDLQGPFSELIHDERTLHTEKMEDAVVSIDDVDYQTKVYKMREVIGFESLNGIEYHEERTRILWINQEFGLLKWTEENNLYSDLLGGASTPVIDENFWYYLIRDDAESETQPSTHTVDLNSTVDLEMIWVEPGTFMMGSPETEEGRGTNETEHNVTLTKGFYLGKYEVTQAQYEAVMTGNTDSLSATPSQYGGNPDRPVEKVSWDDIQKFLTRLNAQEAGNIPAGWAYVLPTEAQWEYACRAGTTTVYSWGNTVTSVNANYNLNIGENSNVGDYPANPWGFYDMHGNVWEWTADWYVAAYPTDNPTIDPTGPASGSSRVLRGGSWLLVGAHLRSAERHSGHPSARPNTFGFRVGFQKQ